MTVKLMVLAGLISCGLTSWNILGADDVDSRAAAVMQEVARRKMAQAQLALVQAQIKQQELLQKLQLAQSKLNQAESKLEQASPVGSEPARVAKRRR